jgi:inhibitor of KinA sporulation pathway (predicted exonuclease)
VLEWKTMARLLDRLLVIDIESTCWEGQPPRGQISEIIEIGLCVVDVARLTRIEKRAILVRPQVSEVSDFCTKLTTITPELARSGMSLEQSLDVLRNEYHSEDRVFASWGDYDRNQFHRNCDYFRLKYPFGPTHWNVKTYFALAHGLAREVGIDAACELVGTELEGTHHRGVDDAWNIAGLLCRLIERHRSPSGLSAS